MADVTLRFREKLNDLCVLGRKSGMRLSVRQIHDAMKQEHLSVEQLQLIYNYLDQMSIEIYDPELSDEASGEGSHRRSLEIYLEELDRFAPLPEDLELQLFDKAAAGDREASHVLIERYLTMVCDLASEFEKERSGVDAEDIVQEANTGLVMAVSGLEKQESLSAYRAYLLNYVTSYLEESVRNLEEMMKSDSRIVNRMNKLADTIRELEDELGHKPSVEELSVFLDLSADDIRELLRVGGENLTAG